MALLRGINVGGKHTLPMAGLAELFVEAGCTGVRTYIQSGNVVFTATPRLAGAVAGVVAGAIGARFGIRVPVVVRAGDEWKRVVLDNPFLKPGTRGRAEIDESALHVAFLSGVPDPRRVKSLDPQRSPGDSFRVRGREIYLHLPHGVARSRLTNSYFDGALGTISTIRNWRTVLKLLDLARA